MDLKRLGDKLDAATVTPMDLINIAKMFDVPLDEQVATAIAAKVPEFISDAGETMTSFVMDGGFLRMLASQMGHSVPQTVSAGRCPHCQNLVFH